MTVKSHANLTVKFKLLIRIEDIWFKHQSEDAISRFQVQAARHGGPGPPGPGGKFFFSWCNIGQTLSCPVSGEMENEPQGAVEGTQTAGTPQSPDPTSPNDEVQPQSTRGRFFYKKPRVLEVPIQVTLGLLLD